MFKISMFAVAVFSIALFTASIYAQDTNQRTRQLVAALDKTKYKKKEKANVTVELYIDVKNEAAVKSDLSAYSGVYGADGYTLSLNVSRDGAVTGTGYDAGGNESKAGKFTLRTARVDGALLTGTKVFADGVTQSFEAVFANRTVSTGKSPTEIASRDTQFGLGFVETDGDSTRRLFLEPTR